MAYTGIQATVDFYIVREADLTNEITDILTSMTRASKDCANLATNTAAERNEVRSEYDPGTDEYKDAMDDVNSKYQTKLSEINAWESELETQKQSLETELKATTTSKESFQAALKQNVTTDSKYGSQGQ